MYIIYIYRERYATNQPISQPTNQPTESTTTPFLQVGTFQMAVLAKAFNVPFYVAAESYKFARLFPLDQRDLPEGKIPKAAFSAPEGTAEAISTFR